MPRLFQSTQGLASRPEHPGREASFVSFKPMLPQRLRQPATSSLRDQREP